MAIANLFNKKKITCWLEDRNFIFLCFTKFTQSRSALFPTILFLPLGNNIHIFAPLCNILLSIESKEKMDHSFVLQYTVPQFHDSRQFASQKSTRNYFVSQLSYRNMVYFMSGGLHLWTKSTLR